MNFDPFNHLLEIQKFIETPTPKVGAHSGVWGFIFSHFPTLSGAWNVNFRLHFWPALLQALTLVVNPRLRLQQCGMGWRECRIESSGTKCVFFFGCNIWVKVNYIESYVTVKKDEYGFTLINFGSLIPILY